MKHTMLKPTQTPSCMPEKEEPELWKQALYPMDNRWYCTSCDYQLLLEGFNYVQLGRDFNYCPHCGTKFKAVVGLLECFPDEGHVEIQEVRVDKKKYTKELKK